MEKVVVFLLHALLLLASLCRWWCCDWGFNCALGLGGATLERGEDKHWLSGGWAEVDKRHVIVRQGGCVEVVCRNQNRPIHTDCTPRIENRGLQNLDVCLEGCCGWHNVVRALELTLGVHVVKRHELRAVARPVEKLVVTEVRDLHGVRVDRCEGRGCGGVVLVEIADLLHTDGCWEALFHHSEIRVFTEKRQCDRGLCCEERVENGTPVHRDPSHLAVLSGRV